VNDFEKDFYRKIKIRKETLSNMDYKDEQLSHDVYISDSESNNIYSEIESNLKDADLSYFQDGYWNISGSKHSMFIKKILRKVIKVFFGWYVFPIYSKQTSFNGKALNTMSLTRNLLIEQKKQIDNLENKLNRLEILIKKQHENILHLRDCIFDYQSNVL